MVVGKRFYPLYGHQYGHCKAKQILYYISQLTKTIATEPHHAT